jgi:hypothetical protein
MGTMKKRNPESLRGKEGKEETLPLSPERIRGRPLAG